MADEHRKLTDNERRFVQEYLVDLNKTKAAQRAGYSEKTAYSIGPQLMKKPHIMAAIMDAMEARAQRTQITQDRILQELGRVALFDPRRLLNEDGTPKPVSELDDDTAAALAGMDIFEEFEGAGKERKFIGYTKKFKLADKVAALGLAMRHLGMLNDKLKVDGQITLAQLIEAAMQENDATGG